MCMEPVICTAGPAKEMLSKQIKSYIYVTVRRALACARKKVAKLDPGVLAAMSVSVATDRIKKMCWHSFFHWPT